MTLSGTTNFGGVGTLTITTNGATLTTGTVTGSPGTIFFSPSTAASLSTPTAFSNGGAIQIGGSAAVTWTPGASFTANANINNGFGITLSTNPLSIGQLAMAGVLNTGGLSVSATTCVVSGASTLNTGYAPLSLVLVVVARPASV